MQSTDDSALLRQYAENNSEEAFAALVTKYINLVYSVAMRSVGNPASAEEITQAVFIILARKAGQLRNDKALSSWLFKTTQLTANNFLRSELRRQSREQEAHDVQTILNEPEPELWPKIAPLLDNAVAALNEKDRRAILLRFYEGKNLRKIGTLTGSNESAAEKRVSRALEKLRKFFTKRGVSSTTAIIAGTISANSVQAAPIGLAATVSTVAVKTAMGVGAGTTALGAATKTGATFGSVGAFLPILGSFYLISKASLEEAKSPRERQFMICFFWIQSVSLLIIIALTVGWLARNSFLHNKAVVSFITIFFIPLAYLFVLAKYAKHRRRQIQIEDGTWVESEPMTNEQRKEFSANLRRNGSKRGVYLYLGMACNMFALVMIELSHVHDGRQHISFLLFLSVFVLFLCIQAWRSRPR